MDKGQDDDLKEKVNEWAFPDINQIVTFESQQNMLEKKRQAEHDQKLKQLEQRQQEMESTKKQYEEKIDFLHKIFSNLQNPLVLIDNEMIEIFDQIIQKIVKKILIKEIKSDPKLLVGMIEELKTMIQQQDNNMLTILLSSEDFKSFKTDTKDKSISVKEEATLQTGDIIIKSNSAEIRALIDERIEKLMSIKK